MAGAGGLERSSEERLAQERSTKAQLGELLDGMTQHLRARRLWKMAQVMAHLARELHVSTDTIYKWRQGEAKPAPETVRALVDLGVREAGMDRLWAEQVLTLGNVPDRAEVLRPLFDTLPAAVHHNLPRRPFQHLIGRARELEQVITRLGPEAPEGIVPIEGMSGIGKTALALEVGWYYVGSYDRLPSGRRFEYVVFASAQSQALTARGTARRNASVSAISDVFRAVAEVLDPTGVIPVDPEDLRREIYARLRRASGRVLLILDSFDRFEGTDTREILAFIRDIPYTTKVIVTTRFHEDLPFPIRLQPLSAADTQQLIEQECRARGIELSDAQSRQLQQDVGGHPLALWWAIGLISQDGASLDETLKRLRDRRQPLLQFVFDEVMYRLREYPEARKSLLALTFFDPHVGAGLAALADIMEMDVEQIKWAVRPLINFNLVVYSAETERYTMLPLTCSYAQQALTNSDAEEEPPLRTWESEARKRWVKWYRSFARVNGGRDWDEWIATYPALDQEWVNLEQIFNWCDRTDTRSAEDSDTLVWFWSWEGVRSFTEIRGLWLSRVTWFDKIIDDPDHFGHWDRLDAQFAKARTLIVLHQLKDARQLLEGMWERAADAPLETRCELASDLSLLFMRLGEHDQAEEWLSCYDALLKSPAAEQLSTRVRRRHQVVHAYYRGVCQLERRQGALWSNDYHEARSWLQRALDWSQDIRWVRASIHAENRLAEIDIATDHLARAERTLTTNLKRAECRQDPREWATCAATRARLYAHKGDVKKNLPIARAAAREAFDAFRALGMLREMAEMEMLQMEFIKRENAVEAD